MSEQVENSVTEEAEDNSDDNLQIIIESPSRKRKTPPKPTESERQIIESIEDELERKLEEKAAKTNLNAVHVKNIIKHVVTNEHVLSLIRNAENAKTGENPVFEPKWTRSKAKELCSVPGVPIPPMACVTPKPLSEVHVLLTEDLQEDSSGDEYVPGVGDEDKEDLESEDDPDSSFFSDPPSVEPPTPPELPAPSTPPPTNWTEDGIFKIPTTPKVKEETVDEATIALRTRSKLCLESTPLEVIEEAFIPPDITTDMYEMDCDNEDWMNFLKTFTRPLDEVDKVPEEEELDPEYNVLSDEEIDKPDKEELRVDKAVKVSRKELNALIAELYEFCTNEQAYLDGIEEDEKDSSTFLKTQLTEGSNLNSTQQEDSFMEQTITKKNDVDLDTSIIKTNIIEDIQIRLIEQQMRQHVQLLTQHFLLTYQHPELHKNSVQMKEYLLNLKYLSGDKEKSSFLSINLHQAINMVKYWEELVDSNTDDVKKMKQHVEKTIYDSLRYKQTGTEYIVTFPTLILETISKSNIFLYPALLPKIPFKSPRFFTAKISSFTDAEVQLIAFGLEQFTPLAIEQINKPKPSKRKIIELVSQYIQDYMLPNKRAKEITTKIYNSDSNRCADNPIKYYFQHNKAPAFVHYYIPLEVMQTLPPCKRKPEELYYQWRSYIFPEKKNTVIQFSPVIVNSIAGVQLYTLSKQVFGTQKSILPNGPVCSTPIRPSRRKSPLKRTSRPQNLLKSKLNVSGDPITKFIDCLSRPSPINRILELYSIDFDFSDIIENTEVVNSTTNLQDKDNLDVRSRIPPEELRSIASVVNNNKIRKGLKSFIMLPNMPSLCTPIKVESQELDNSAAGSNADLAKRNISLEISEVGVSNFSSSILQNVSETSDSSNQFSKVDTPKDTQDTVSTTSSTVKPIPRRELSGGEKKKAKLKKEFLANLSISTPEDHAIEQKKNEMFAMAYYDKMRETLEIESYHKMIQILNDYEEGDAVDLYFKVESILRPKYKDLADEFLLFLREREAAAVGHLVPWIRMNNKAKFLRKLELYFKDQPAQLRKIYQCLTELSQTVGVSMEKLKTTLIPMFKGNAILTDLFLQNFLNEPPPPSLLEGPYEVIDVNKELAANEDEEPFETITVPDTEDKYGGSTCICNCHEIEDAEFKSRFRHCSRCGTKFLNGRVYIQTGRGLRPATVSFINSPNVEHSARLADKSLQNFFQRKKRSDSSPSKQASSKDIPDEETDEDGDKKKKSKRKPQRKKKQTSVKDAGTKDPQKKRTASRARNLNKEFKSSPRKRNYLIKKSNTIPKVEQVEEPIEIEEHNIKMEHEEQVETELEEQVDTELEDKTYTKPGSSIGQKKRLHEESCEEGEQSAAGESSSEVKLGSPEQHTAESESEFCEESSQDNCESDSNSSTSSALNRSQSYADVLEQNTSWRREEDKIILEVFQTENDKDNAFRAIANQLKNRTVDEIKSRFDTLMELLMKAVEDHRD